MIIALLMLELHLCNDDDDDDTQWLCIS